MVVACGRPFGPIWLVVVASLISLESNTAVEATFVSLREPFLRCMAMVFLFFFDDVKR